ncbi:MAG: 4Fe-4S binding protein [Clostridia bacterium]|nr:4Fe-4S binding protein [Clostridia bacterium]
MIRDIITIDEEKCNGCALCVNACHEGALQMVDGKAKLISESYCDGLGDCLPECPTGAIKIEKREAADYDEEEVKKRMGKSKSGQVVPCSCPSTAMNTFEHRSNDKHETSKHLQTEKMEPQLRQWPCQLQLVPVNAPFFNQAKLLIAADCTAYAYADIHNSFMKGKITLIGCPKLDSGDYAAKLSEIIKNNLIESVQVLRMTVPCCGGLVNSVKQALINSGKMIPWSVVTISPEGNIIE